MAVAFALSRLGDDAVRAQVAADIARLAPVGDRERSRRCRAHAGRRRARAWMDRTVLRTLLADADTEVVNAALAALRWPEDAALLPAIAVQLDHRRTAGAAVDALVRVGEPALVVVDDGLRSDEHGRHVQEMLVRVGREIGGPSAIAVLRGHVEHHDREVGLAVMRALAALGPATGRAGDRVEASDTATTRPISRARSWRTTSNMRPTPCGARRVRGRPGGDAAVRRAAGRARADPPARPRRLLDAPRHCGFRPGRLPARAARRAIPCASRWSGSTSR